MLHKIFTKPQMKNLSGETAKEKLFGNRVERMRFVSDSDIKDKKILDVGCGFGWCAYNFLGRGAGQIVGLDMTDDSREAFESLSEKKVSFVQGSALELPFEDNSFDTVVSWEVIEHVPKNKEPQMLSEIKRVLKPGGKFYLSTPFDSWGSKLLDPAWWLIGHRHYTIDKITKMFLNAGLEVEEIYSKGGIYTMTYGLNNYISKWIFRRPPFFEKKVKEWATKEYEKDSGWTNIFVRASA